MAIPEVPACTLIILGMALELRLKEQLCVMDSGLLERENVKSSYDPISGMICKLAICDVHRTLLMAMLLITVYPKMQTNEQKQPEVPGIKNFLSDLQMADQYNR